MVLRFQEHHRVCVQASKRARGSERKRQLQQLSWLRSQQWVRKTHATDGRAERHAACPKRQSHRIWMRPTSISSTKVCCNYVREGGKIELSVITLGQNMHSHSFHFQPLLVIFKKRERKGRKEIEAKETFLPRHGLLLSLTCRLRPWLCVACATRWPPCVYRHLLFRILALALLSFFFNVSHTLAQPRISLYSLEQLENYPCVWPDFHKHFWSLMH